RQRLDVAALALGVDRVEGEARLARAGQAGDDHQRVAREGDVEVLEVVLARAGDDDLVNRARPGLRGRHSYESRDPNGCSTRVDVGAARAARKRRRGASATGARVEVVEQRVAVR